MKNDLRIRFHCDGVPGVCKTIVVILRVIDELSATKQLTNNQMPENLVKELLDSNMALAALPEAHTPGLGEIALAEVEILLEDGVIMAG